MPCIVLAFFRYLRKLLQIDKAYEVMQAVEYNLVQFLDSNFIV